MSGERTEKATPRRRSETRKKGQIPKSADFNSAVMLTIGVYLASIFFKYILEQLKELLILTFTSLHPDQINPENIPGIITFYITVCAKMLGPFLICLMIFGFLVVGLQVGPFFSFEPIKPKIDKFSPVKLWGNFVNTFNLFKTQKLVELAKSFIKLFVIVGFAWFVLSDRLQDLLSLLGVDLTTAFAVIADIMKQIIFNICIAMIIIGIIDKIYQHYEFEKSIKMTKQEVKDERKNAEGDPAIKAKIRSKQFAFAQSRMMSSIPSADVVVVNPTHYAVALRYDISIAPAPQLVAKGTDFVAFKIREVAEYNNVPIVENPPLARALYKLVPIEGLIPAELFTAVAELLAYVYKKRKATT